jgi:hypothetical protein
MVFAIWLAVKDCPVSARQRARGKRKVRVAPMVDCALSLAVLKRRLSAERLVFSCEVLGEHSDRGSRQLQGLS